MLSTIIVKWVCVIVELLRYLIETTGVFSQLVTSTWCPRNAIQPTICTINWPVVIFLLHLHDQDFEKIVSLYIGFKKTSESIECLRREDYLINIQLFGWFYCFHLHFFVELYFLFGCKHKKWKKISNLHCYTCFFLSGQNCLRIF